MLNTIRYRDDFKEQWDSFITNSKNGNFLFYRKYMDYHADRFCDHSLMFFNNEQLTAILPATENELVIISHGGLTFGGIISDHSVRAETMLEVFDLFLSYYHRLGYTKILYKPIPYIYHLLPADEDLYALFINKAILLSRNISSALSFDSRVRFSKGRKHSVSKAKKAGLGVRVDTDYRTFMAIEEQVLRTYHQTVPVHTAREIEMLAGHFPDHIKLFCSYLRDRMLAGVIVYESKNVAHTQYIGATDEGRTVGASDIIFDFLINEYYVDKKYFDFGTSTENGGHYLNRGLIANKEGYGARAVVYDTYELTIQ